jgi:hypothetical protein
MGLKLSSSVKQDAPTPPRLATLEDRTWLCRHWAPHLNRMAQLIYESRNYAKGAVHYLAGAHTVGTINAYTPQQVGGVDLVATHPNTHTPVCVTLDTLNQWLSSEAKASAAAYKDTPRPRPADVTLFMDIRGSDGSYSHYRGFS